MANDIMFSKVYTGTYNSSTNTFTVDGSIPVGGVISDITQNGSSSIGTTDVFASAGQYISANGSITAYQTATNGDVVFSDEVGTPYLFTNNNYAVSDTSTLNVDSDNSVAYTYCFLVGTRISTPTGLIPVEQLVIGDKVLNADGKTAKIRFNFKQVKTSHAFAGTKHYPIKISAGALADNIPSADLFVTPDHAIYFPALNIFAEASTLINGISIYQLTEMPASFTYYHLLCENQEIVLAENTPAETFIDNATMAEFDNYAEYVALYPEHNEMIELDIPRAKSYRQLPRELKQDLLQRAELLYPSVKSKAA